VQTDQYTDADKWAEDIAAIIDELALDRVILVGWSYGATSFRTMSAEKAKARLLELILSIRIMPITTPRFARPSISVGARSATQRSRQRAR
jgi:pimeloyl-ACP methyl ester carboxylesterase